MDISLKHDKAVPIYRQIVEQISRRIEDGSLPPQSRLPTVRDFAREQKVSRGTVKHAYDTLEKLGFIRMVQGSGSFVCDTAAHSSQENEGPGEALAADAASALDDWIDDMLASSFTLADIRLMMEERFAARLHMGYTVRVAAVDCTPEAQAVMHRQFIRIPNVAVSDHLLEDVLSAPNMFDPDVDIIVTTPTHFEELSAKTNPDRHIIQLVMAIATGTALELAAIPADTRVGILCASQRFGEIIRSACDEYAELNTPPGIACASDIEGMLALARNCDQLILAPNFRLFLPARELSLLRHKQPPCLTITYQYQIERGSLLFLEEQVSQIYEARLAGK